MSLFLANSLFLLGSIIICETEKSVLVIIKHEKLASPEEMVTEYLQNSDRIANSIEKSIAGFKSENTMKFVFWKLRDAGMIMLVEAGSHQLG